MKFLKIFDCIIPDYVNKIYIDVGLAADAPNTISWLQEDKNAFVFGFEPVPQNCVRVHNLINKLGFIDRFKLFEYAVDSEETGTIKKFFITRNSEIQDDHGQSSLYRVKESLKDSIWVSDEIDVTCVNLSDFLNSLDWDRFSQIEILKTDTQGNDFNILKSIVKWFPKIAQIKSESHCYNQYQREETHVEMANFMKEQGFMLRDYINNPDHNYFKKE